MGKAEFRRWAKDHYNFMTPRIKSVFQVNDFYIELSEGSDFGHSPMYGVTVFQETDGAFRGYGLDNNLNKLFHDYDMAREYVTYLKKERLN